MFVCIIYLVHARACILSFLSGGHIPERNGPCGRGGPLEGAMIHMAFTSTRCSCVQLLFSTLLGGSPHEATWAGHGGVPQFLRGSPASRADLPGGCACNILPLHWSCGSPSFIFHVVFHVVACAQWRSQEAAQLWKASSVRRPDSVVLCVYVCCQFHACSTFTVFVNLWVCMVAVHAPR